MVKQPQTLVDKVLEIENRLQLYLAQNFSECRKRITKGLNIIVVPGSISRARAS
ncbi:MAG TPA: hypothetical protein PK644_08670 [bacterium]|nr:hypothetical protein [bacterium]